MLLYEDLVDIRNVLLEHKEVLKSINSYDSLDDLRIMSLVYLIEHELGLNEK